MESKVLIFLVFESHRQRHMRIRPEIKTVSSAQCFGTCGLRLASQQADAQNPSWIVFLICWNISVLFNRNCIRLSSHFATTYRNLLKIRVDNLVEHSLLFDNILSKSRYISSHSLRTPSIPNTISFSHIDFLPYCFRAGRSWTPALANKKDKTTKTTWNKLANSSMPQSLEFQIWLWRLQMTTDCLGCNAKFRWATCARGNDNGHYPLRIDILRRFATLWMSDLQWCEVCATENLTRLRTPMTKGRRHEEKNRIQMIFVNGKYCFFFGGGFSEIYIKNFKTWKTAWF